ncbi:MAG: hypothetical protein AAFX53_04610 [Bacteroidota bacterium]
MSTGPDWADPIRQDDDEKRATGQKTGKADDCPEGELLLPIRPVQILNEINDPCAARIVSEANLMDSDIAEAMER